MNPSNPGDSTPSEVTHQADKKSVRNLTDNNRSDLTKTQRTLDLTNRGKKLFFKYSEDHLQNSGFKPQSKSQK